MTFCRAIYDKDSRYNFLSWYIFDTVFDNGIIDLDKEKNNISKNLER